MTPVDIASTPRRTTSAGKSFQALTMLPSRCVCKMECQSPSKLVLGNSCTASCNQFSEVVCPCQTDPTALLSSNVKCAGGNIPFHTPTTHGRTGWGSSMICKVCPCVASLIFGRFGVAPVTVLVTGGGHNVCCIGTTGGGQTLWIGTGDVKPGGATAALDGATGLTGPGNGHGSTALGGRTWQATGPDAEPMPVDARELELVKSQSRNIISSSDSSPAIVWQGFDDCCDCCGGGTWPRNPCMKPRAPGSGVRGTVLAMRSASALKRASAQDCAMEAGGNGQLDMATRANGVLDQSCSSQ